MAGNALKQQCFFVQRVRGGAAKCAGAPKRGKWTRPVSLSKMGKSKTGDGNKGKGERRGGR